LVMTAFEHFRECLDESFGVFVVVASQHRELDPRIVRKEIGYELLLIGSGNAVTDRHQIATSLPEQFQ